MININRIRRILSSGLLVAGNGMVAAWKKIRDQYPESYQKVVSLACFLNRKSQRNISIHQTKFSI